MNANHRTALNEWWSHSWNQAIYFRDHVWSSQTSAITGQSIILVFLMSLSSLLLGSSASGSGKPAIDKDLDALFRATPSVR
jgi:hypothetical protein